ncbi:hypothetical protein NOX69_005907, partial [Pseudomonas aeruginosa]
MTLGGQTIDPWGAYPLTLEGRPFEPFPWRINGLRAFFDQANRLLTLHNLYIKPGCYNRMSKKAANRPKVPRR